MENEQDASKTPPAESAAEEPESFSDLYRRSLDRIQEGEVITGTILRLDEDYALVDIGYKSEGLIPLSEFLDEQGRLTVKVGDTVNVFLEKMENENGLVVLSKEKADKINIWDEISRVYEGQGAIEGKIVAKTKGGLSVDVGVKAFLPGSQVDIRPVRNLDRLIGQTYHFRILKFNKKRGNIVLSRRVLLEDERARLREETLKRLQEGMIIDGVVKNITDYGAFVDLGGFDGLLHITDMSWGRIGHPSDRFQVGDRVKVKVLKFDREKGKVALGVKQVLPDPWATVAQRYHPGDRIRGRVVNITDYGAFVELEEGIEGLIHVSEMSWTKRVKHPSKVVTVGDVVEVAILDVDPGNRRISLGMKQVEPNPWDKVAEQFPVGTRITGKVKNMTDFGIFIGVTEGIDGLVHISDISWSKRIKHPSDLYQKGQTVEAMVLSIDRENERLSLGVKQLTRDPWENVGSRFPAGTIVGGAVTNVTDFGAFLEIEEGVEGLVHVSEMARDKVRKPSDLVKIGETVVAKVIAVDEHEKKISLSLRQVTDAERRLHEVYAAEPGAGATHEGDSVDAALLREKAEPSGTEEG